MNSHGLKRNDHLLLHNNDFFSTMASPPQNSQLHLNSHDTYKEIQKEKKQKRRYYCNHHVCQTQTRSCADPASERRAPAYDEALNRMANSHHCYLSMSPSLSILLRRSRYRTARTSRISRIRLLQFRKR